MVTGTVAADYFFGKSVTGAGVTVTASKFDVAFERFAEVTGTTDGHGSFDFNLRLPSYFVANPCSRGRLRFARGEGSRHGRA